MNLKEKYPFELSTLLKSIEFVIVKKKNRKKKKKEKGNVEFDRRKFLVIALVIIARTGSAYRYRARYYHLDFYSRYHTRVTHVELNERISESNISDVTSFFFFFRNF